MIAQALTISGYNTGLYTSPHLHTLRERIRVNGSLISEAEFAQSKADFINKMSIALKEANETKYWIDLLHDCDYLNQKMHDDIIVDIKELISLLVSIVKSSKNNP